MKVRKLPRWSWPLLAAMCVLALLLAVLLRNSSSGEPGTESAAGVGKRAPFPKGGAFSGVHRATEIEPRNKDRSAPEAWQQGRKSK
jgi:hypothetical protein